MGTQSAMLPLCIASAVCAMLLQPALSQVQAETLRFAPWSAKVAEKEQCISKPVQSGAMPPANRDLQVLLEAASVRNIVAFTIGDEDTVDSDEVEQWVMRLECLGVHLLVLSHSQDLARKYAKIGALGYYSQDYFEKAVELFGNEMNDNNNNLMKWVFLDTITASGYSALYVNEAVVWFKDPRPELALMGYDVLVRQETSSQEEMFAAEELRAIENGQHIPYRARRDGRGGKSAGCCTDISTASLDVALVRNTNAARSVIAAARFRSSMDVGGCRTAAMWGLYELCQPLGSVQCGVMPAATVSGYEAFALTPTFREAKADGSVACGDRGRPCSWEALLRSGPQLLDFGTDRDFRDKDSIRKLDRMWPPCVKVPGTEHLEF